MPPERETLEVDVLFVGAGPANLSGALHLKSLVDAESQRQPASRLGSISIAIIEKGREIGAHTLSGAILDPVALHELLPNYHELSPPPADSACPPSGGGVMPHPDESETSPPCPVSGMAGGHGYPRHPFV